MNGIVDRFEGEIVVIEMEDGNTKDYSRSKVDPRVKAGDCVMMINDKWVTDEEKTRQRTIAVQKLMKELWDE